MKVAILSLSIFASLFFVSACDDASRDSGESLNSGQNGGLSNDSGDPFDDGDSFGDGNAQGSGSFNNGLDGRIITTYRNIPVQFDLSTGRMSELAVETIQDWLVSNNQDQGWSYSSYFGTGGLSSSQYVQTIPECFRSEASIGVSYDSCVAVFGANYQKQEQFRIREVEVVRAHKLSPTGRYLAVNDYGGPGRTALLLISVADKTTLSRVDFDVGESGPRYVNTNPSPMAWAPDESLIYTVPSDERVVVYITKPGSLDVARSIRLPATYQGDVVSLDVSPDGTQLLMGYDPKVNFDVNGVLLLDLNSLQISIPAIVSSEVGIVPLGDNIKGNIRAPTWSPDGRWIIVLEGTGRYFGFGVTTQARLFAVPANKSRTVLSLDSSTDSIPINVEYPDRQGTLTNSWNGDILFELELDWIE